MVGWFALLMILYYFLIYSLDKLYYKANTDLELVKQCLDNNSLEFNFDKSYYLHNSITKLNIDVSRYKIVLYNNRKSSQNNVGW